MNALRICTRGLLLSVALLPFRVASAQCLQWESTFATQGFNGAVNALVVFQSCTGGEPSLYAGGAFTTAGGTPCARVARWNGSVWSPVGAGLPGIVNALCVYDDGSGGGPELYAGGDFGIGPCGTPQGLAKWDGSAWTMICDPAVTGGVAPIEALATYDDGGGVDLYVGGLFDILIGGFGTSDIARWDGTNFSRLGAGARGTFTSHVAALTVFDNGSGPELVAAGEFSFPSNAIAHWNGTSWGAFASGLGGFLSEVDALAVYDDGSGAKLFAGGNFGDNFARWNGSAWQSVGGTVNGVVRSLVVYGDGSGSPAALYAGGTFSTVNAVSASRIARWDGAIWTSLGTGIDTSPGTVVRAMAAFDDHRAGGSDLYVGGIFATAGGVTSPNIAEWSGCGNLTGTAFCFGDGSLATPCPCALPNTVPSPSGALRHGCANSFNLDGAQLFGRGSTALDNVVLTSSGQSPAAFAFFFVGTAEVPNGIAIADGVRCAGGALTRFGSQFAVCGSVKYPNAAAGWTLPLSTVSGTTPGSGLTKYYQVFYRNAAASFCSAGTANFTSGYQLVW